LRLSFVELDGPVDRYRFALKFMNTGELIRAFSENDGIEDVVWKSSTKVDECRPSAAFRYLGNDPLNRYETSDLLGGILWRDGVSAHRSGEEQCEPCGGKQVE
jgi:hypothetical protein